MKRTFYFRHSYTSKQHNKQIDRYLKCMMTKFKRYKTTRMRNLDLLEILSRSQRCNFYRKLQNVNTNILTTVIPTWHVTSTLYLEIPLFILDTEYLSALAPYEWRFWLNMWSKLSLYSVDFKCLLVFNFGCTKPTVSTLISFDLW